MPCILSDSPTLDADYQGAIGSTFTITAVCPTAVVGISGAQYGTTVLTAGPYTFKIVVGVTTLVVIAESGALNVLIQIQEVCPGGGTKTLRQFEMSDPDHTATSVWIKGV